MASLRPSPATSRSMKMNNKHPSIAIVTAVLLAEHLAICGGHLWHEGNASFIQRWGVVFGLAICFDIVTEVWLDAARIHTLERRIAKNAAGVSEAATKAHDQRKSHARAIAPLRFPWLGEGNWHYETSHCLRDAILSLACVTLYFVSHETFNRWWLALVWGTYSADMLFLLVRSPAISHGWLSFVTYHHTMTGVFLAASSFLSTKTHPATLQAIALVWFSNVFTTGPIVVRSFLGQENLYIYAAGVSIQRALRWTGFIIAVVAAMENPRLYLLSTPYFHISGGLAFLCIEYFDIKGQVGKICSLRKNGRRHDALDKVRLTQLASTRHDNQVVSSEEDDAIGV